MKKVLLVLAVVIIGFLPGVKVFAADTVSYIKADGTSDSVSNYTVLSSGSTSWDASNSAWYVVPSGGVTISTRITVTGTVNLILTDGATLTASQGITVAFADANSDGKSDNVLNIYGQSEGTGKLIAKTTDKHSAAIGGLGYDSTTATRNAGIITINGGIVKAEASASSENSSYGAGIGGGEYGDGGTITINGGTVTATATAPEGSSSFGSGIGGGFEGSGGEITINGGTVTATATASNGSSFGSGIGGGRGGSGGEITINGGTVTAEATASNIMNSYGAGIGGGYLGNGAAINKKITINGGYVTAIGGSNAEGIGKGKDDNDSGTLTIGSGVKLLGDKTNDHADPIIVLSGVTDSPITYTGDRARYMKALGPVTYTKREWNDDTKEIDKTDVTLSSSQYDYVRSSVNSWVVPDGKIEGWYVVTNDVTIPDRITVSGTVNLILCDGVTLTAEKGITVSSGNTLNIYGQSEDSGKLIAMNTAEYLAAIGNIDYNTEGTITINGGNITAKSTQSDGFGLFANDITILGEKTKVYANCTVNGEGTVYALVGASGSGVWGGNSIFITDASLYAMGIGNNEIGVNSLPTGKGVTINSGTLTAIGGSTDSAEGGHGIGGNVIATGGTITAKGGNASTNGGHGINGTLTVSSGSPTITATGGNATSSGGMGGYGIEMDVTVSGGSPIIKAIGGNATSSEGGHGGNGIGNSTPSYVKVEDGSPTIIAKGGNSSNTGGGHGIIGSVTVSSGTPTILASGGEGLRTGKDIFPSQGIYDEISISPESIRVYKGETEDGPWTLAALTDGKTIEQFVKIYEYTAPSPQPVNPTPVTPDPVIPDPSPTSTPVSDESSPAYGKTPAEAPKTETIGDKTVTTTKYTDGSIGVKTEEKTADGKEIVSEKITEQNGSWVQKTVETAQDGSKVEKHETSDKTGDNTTSKIVKTDASGKVTETETSSKSTDANKVVTEKHSIVNSEGSINETTITKPNEDYNKVVEKRDPNGNLIEKVESSRTTAEDNSVTYTLSTLDENKNTVESTQTMKDGVGPLQVKETKDGKETSTSYAINGDETSVTEFQTTEASVTIADTVQGLDGKTYAVTEIGANALRDNKFIEKLSLGANIRRICANAFRETKNLKELILGGMNNLKMASPKGLDKGTSKIVLEKNCLKGTSKKLKIYVQNKADKKAVQEQLGKAGNKKAKVKVEQ